MISKVQLDKQAASSPASQDSGDDVPLIRIEASQGWVALRLREVWDYRELLYFLTWRDIKIRYKQTVLGISWAILQPLITAIIFSIIFGRYVRTPSDGVPHLVFIFTALVPWTFFATRLAQASNSLVQQANLITKVYFPRLAMPFAIIIGGIIDFILAFVVLLGILFFYGIAPGLNTIWLLPLLMMVMVTALGVSLWLSALNVQFRDVQYVVPFIVQIGYFVSPIVYSSSIIENPLHRLIYALNPMASVIDGFRWALLGTSPPHAESLLVSGIVALLLLGSGLFYFRRMERSFADVV